MGRPHPCARLDSATWRKDDQGPVRLGVQPAPAVLQPAKTRSHRPVCRPAIADDGSDWERNTPLLVTGRRRPPGALVPRTSRSDGRHQPLWGIALTGGDDEEACPRNLLTGSCGAVPRRYQALGAWSKGCSPVPSRPARAASDPLQPAGRRQRPRGRDRTHGERSEIQRGNGIASCGCADRVREDQRRRQQSLLRDLQELAELPSFDIEQGAGRGSLTSLGGEFQRRRDP